MGIDLVELSKVRSLAKSGTARAIRRSAGVSAGEVAEAVGVSSSTVLRWEDGERAPRGEAALRYGAILQGLLRR